VLKSRVNKMFDVKEEEVIDLDKIKAPAKPPEKEEDKEGAKEDFYGEDDKDKIKPPVMPKKFEIGADDKEIDRENKDGAENKKDDEPIDIDKIVDMFK
jgi:hypothetical protein